MNATPFARTVALRFGDCDPSGIAYFPRYMDMMVGVTEDLFAAIGYGWATLARDRHIVTPTVSLSVSFRRPGFQGDALRFICRVTAIGRSSLDLDHEVHAAELLWTARQRLVATSTENRRSVGWPDDIRDALRARLETRHG